MDDKKKEPEKKEDDKKDPYADRFNSPMRGFIGDELVYDPDAKK